MVAGLTLDRTMIRLDNLVYDHLLRLDRPKVVDPIVLVEIDEESLRRIGRWPWRRDIHADLVESLARAKPRAIAYDVLFTEDGDKSKDRQLGAALAKAHPIFLPVSLMAPGSGGAAFDVTLPIPPLREAVSDVGFTNLQTDADGFVRSAPVTLDSDHGLRQLMDLVREQVAPGTATASGPRLIPFARRPGYWPTVSAGSVFAGEVPAELLHDKIILVGATAPGLASHYPVPVGGVMSGLEVEANLLHGLIGNRMIRQAGSAATLAFSLLPLLGLMIALGPLPRIPAVVSFALSALVILAISAASLSFLRVWLPPGAALAGLLVAYPLWGWRQLAVAQRFMKAELLRFEQEPPLLPNIAQPTAQAGAVGSTISLLRSTIARHREMRHFVTAALDQLPDATLITSVDGEIVLGNAAAKQLFSEPPVIQGLVAGRLLARFQLGGRPLSISFPSGPDAPTNIEASLEDGRCFSIKMAEQASLQGERIGWIIRFMDISEAKAAQRQREDIVHLLTHDMRSPQASILAVLETSDPLEIKPEASARIRHYAERTLGLADGFVQLARAENLDYVLEEIDLSDMLMDAIDDLWPQSKAKQISITTLGEKERLLVIGERSLITRALVNVIGNAVKFSPERSAVSCNLSREIGADGAFWARCAISDRGPGLAQEHRQRIFERFHRGPIGVGPSVEGVGLGLSFVHTVMVRHGGEIRCDSEFGKGTTFTLLLPTAQVQDQTKAVEAG
ncbi:CHASE2 domain-containing sensor protein/nitrogen-specific signal transduction histidine kinase [Sphingobium sp. B11D3B]|uniref:CHASE2 and HATPase_c domain-containing protein n=1 Tax=Sphingobium sp. B11D3B TaxID=2940575 RepID=UPI002227E2E0|nr:CHASE2 and HATPase_c domain-containing protein [Sphingobium sp. B11D3B]MCW2389619.1 CHASE2 domain-containing sensor protein/nitrogen-specific signal transduction histidine kinase [Sphingobium sp. B11D3B]